MSSSGPNSPGTLADNSGFGTAIWSNPSNAGASDNSYATATAAVAVDTHYLKATNFGFAIPPGATIDGIVVEVEKKVSAGTLTVDQRVRIVKGGAVGSTDKSSGTAWSTSEGYVTYGAANDLWGESWTDADINDTTFGVVIAGGTTEAIPPTLSIDHIRITVYYTPGPDQAVASASGTASSSVIGSSQSNAVGSANGVAASVVIGIGLLAVIGSGAGLATVTAVGTTIIVGDANANAVAAGGTSNAIGIGLGM